MPFTKSAAPAGNWLIFQYQVKSQRPSRTGIKFFAAFILCLTLVASINAQQSPAEEVAEIRFGVGSEINVYVSDKDIEVTRHPIQTEIIATLKNP